MNIQDNYLKNRKNIFFSLNKDIQIHREKLINIFENDSFDRKNNESLKNINLKNFINFKYKYLISEETSVINNTQENNYSIVSVNGQCSSFKDDKIEITKISDEDYNDFSENNTIEKNDHFVNLNSLFLNSGFKIIIKKNNNIKIKISNIVTDDDLTIFQKNNIICEEGSSLNLIEEYENKNNATSNILNVIKLEKNSQLNHFLIQDNSPNHNLIITSHSSCKKNSTYNQKVYNFSEGYVRNFHYSELIETNSETDLQGIFFLKDDNKSNNKTFVKHLAEDCKSNQVYKGILNDYSKATYFSNTHVDQVAQKTEGYQLSKGILLSDNASYFSKPELKIYADDVKCSHGSTIGPIDENSIFYLRSRGMSKIAATKILISSFINEELSSIDNEQMYEIIQKKLVRYLSKVK